MHGMQRSEGRFSDLISHLLTRQKTMHRQIVVNQQYATLNREF